VSIKLGEDQSIEEGNREYKSKLIDLIKKDNDKSLFTTIDSFEKERQPPNEKWKIIRI
jgi:hypothetical protein